MAEQIDPVTTDVAAISHRGILIIMAAVVAVEMVFGSAFAGMRFGSGVLFGGVMSFANYMWLDRSTKAIFQPDAIATSGILAAKYIFRYVAIGAVLLLVYMTGAFPMTAVILGLSAFAIAVVIQGLKNIIFS